ncbi:tetraspanin-32 isoform X1 [Phyllostomus discolor]|uniref:Tetraspanin-32 isoform X1 n=1 Tax=Phyllostomus discolor TaxID=89673 RepID=A0A7E6E3Y8_9CHIR|nr:tetraspanin-32 isoform X1 [Phyllostomus discolor]
MRFRLDLPPRLLPGLRPWAALTRELASACTLPRRGAHPLHSCLLLLTHLLPRCLLRPPQEQGAAGPPPGRRGGSRPLRSPLCRPPACFSRGVPLPGPAPLGLPHGDQPGRAPRPGGRAERRGRRAGGPTPHGRGLPVLRAGVLCPGPGGLLETAQPHPGGGHRVGHLRPGLRPGGEEPAWRLATGAAGHPGHVPVLREELAFRPAGRRGGRPVSGSGGCLAGLPAGHPELPEDARTGHLHPGQRGPRLHGVRNAAQLLPVVCHLLRPQPGPQRDLCPEPPSPRPAAPGAQLLQTLRGGPRPCPASARRPGPQRTLGEPLAAPGPLTLCADPPPTTCLATGAPLSRPRALLENKPGPLHGAGVGKGSPARDAAPCVPTGPGSPMDSPEQAGSWAGAGEPGGLCGEAQAPRGRPGPRLPSRLPPRPPATATTSKAAMVWGVLCRELLRLPFSTGWRGCSTLEGSILRPVEAAQGTPPSGGDISSHVQGVPCAPAPPGSHSTCLGNRDRPRWGRGCVLRSDLTAPRRTAVRLAWRGHGPAQLAKGRGWRGPRSSTDGHQGQPRGTSLRDVQPRKGQAPTRSPRCVPAPTSPTRAPPEHRCAHLHRTRLSSRRGPCP